MKKDLLQISQCNFDKISSTTTMPYFNSKITEKIFTGKNTQRLEDADKDVLIFQYVEFCQLMRNELISGSRSGDLNGELDEDNSSALSTELS